ncbi:MAG TPA: ATP-binding cassette domain-containing protein [Steroidobacteraceae bacterium]|nr:ATP-binding cassette domain-containing protein [Steroidobacteraceae bacterium]
MPERRSGSRKKAPPKSLQVCLKELDLHRAGRAVLQGISWTVASGERWLVTGENGAGKTQLLKIVSGDVWPDPGRKTRHYRLRDEIHDEPAEVRDAIAWLGPERQDRYERYGWNFTALQVVGTGLQRTDIPMRSLTAAETTRCRVLLRRAGILRLSKRGFLTLSYGERRLVLLARAIAWNASLLLLDEVATGLDAPNRRRLFRLLASPELRHAGWVCTAHRREDVPPQAAQLLWLHRGAVRYAGRLKSEVLTKVFGATRPASARSSVARASVPTHARVLVELQRASVWIDEHRILSDVDFTIRRGECWIVHGGNGSGKSTLLRTLYGDLGVASGGQIRRAGVAPGVPLEDFRARTGLVAPHLQTDYPRHHSVLETVVSGLHSSIGLNFPATPVELGRARSSLRQFDLLPLADRKLAEISYGQMRRVLFARAAVLRPRLLLLDEPFTGLAPAIRADLLARLEAWIGRGVTVVMATHYHSEWPQQATHELVLTRGRVRQAGTIAR